MSRQIWAFKRYKVNLHSYLSIENFKIHCLLFLALKNMDKKFGLSLHSYFAKPRERVGEERMGT